MKNIFLYLLLTLLGRHEIVCAQLRSDSDTFKVVKPKPDTSAIESKRYMVVFGGGRYYDGARIDRLDLKGMDTAGVKVRDLKTGTLYQTSSLKWTITSSTDNSIYSGYYPDGTVGGKNKTGWSFLYDLLRSARKADILILSEIQYQNKKVLLPVSFQFTVR